MGEPPLEGFRNLLFVSKIGERGSADFTKRASEIQHVMEVGLWPGAAIYLGLRLRKDGNPTDTIMY